MLMPFGIGPQSLVNIQCRRVYKKRARTYYAPTKADASAGARVYIAGRFKVTYNNFIISDFLAYYFNFIM